MYYSGHINYVACARSPCNVYSIQDVAAHLHYIAFCSLSLQRILHTRCCGPSPLYCFLLALLATCTAYKMLPHISTMLLAARSLFNVYCIQDVAAHLHYIACARFPCNVYSMQDVAAHLHSIACSRTPCNEYSIHDVAARRSDLGCLGGLEWRGN